MTVDAYRGEIKDSCEKDDTPRVCHLFVREISHSSVPIPLSLLQSLSTRVYFCYYTKYPLTNHAHTVRPSTTALRCHSTSTAVPAFAGSTSTCGPNSEPVHLTRWKLETSGGNSLRTLYPLHSLHTMYSVHCTAHIQNFPRLTPNLGTVSHQHRLGAV
jgi:hypothetical protein